MKRIIQIILIICAFILVPVKAEELKYNVRFSNLSSGDGLSNSHVNCIFQDSYGYIWIGTVSGLTRYDGQEIKVFSYDPYAPDKSISNQSVHDIYEDENKNLWFATEDGITIYDRFKNEYDYIKHDKNNHNSLCYSHIRDITRDVNGDFWFASYGGGISHYNKESNTFANYSNIPGNKESLPSDRVNKIFVDSKENIWIATEAGGLSRFDRDTHKFFNYIYSPSYKIASKVSIINSIQESSDGLIYIGSWGNGMIVYDYETDKFVQYNHQKGCDNCPSSNIVTYTIEDSEKNIWLATFGQGINKFNPDSKTFTRYYSDETRASYMQTNSIWTLFIDYEKVLWVGTYGKGVYYSDITRQKFYHFNSANSKGIETNSVTSIYQDSKNNLWVGTDGEGLYKLNIHKRVFTKELVFENEVANYVRCIFEDSFGRIWIGNDEGLVQYNPVTKDTKFYSNSENNPNSIGFRSVYSLEEDVFHNLWIGIWGYGIDMLSYKESLKENPDKANFVKFPTQSNTSNTSPPVLTYAFASDSSDLYLASFSGLVKFNFKEQKFEKILDYALNTLTQFNDSILFLGSSGYGLFEYNKNTGMFKLYNTDDGLINNLVVGIVKYAQNEVWISTEGGISRFEYNTKQFLNFSEINGLQGSEFKINARALLNNGMIAFGGNNGINVFDPTEIEYKNVSPKFAIIDIQVKDYPHLNIKSNNIKRTELVPESIDLKANQNTITFHYGVFSYIQSDKNKISYKLEGVENKWQPTTNRNRKATYSNLSPGKYIFKLRASDVNGSYSNDIKETYITIHPPFWKTWWFITLLIITVSMFIYLFIRRRINSIKKHAILLEKLVDERTKELANKNHELELQSDRLNKTNTLLEENQQHIREQAEELRAQRDELHDANAVKDKFFSIIAHDLKNPFNTLLGFSDILVRQYNTYDEEKRYTLVNMINESATKIYDLLINLLNWSRSQRDVIEFNPREEDIIHLIQSNITLLENVAKAKNINFKTEFTQEHIMCNMDADLINTVLRNLISNAIKFSFNDSTIKISAKLSDDRKNVNVSVTDYGTGIPAETIRKLFKPNMHITTYGTNKEKGTGLGLIICKDFVLKHNGKIWVDSVEGKGSTFSFYIPIHQ